MNLQQKMLAEMKAEMDARTEAIIAAADLCHEAEAIAEALSAAGMASAAKGWCWAKNAIDIHVSPESALINACDVIEAIYMADLEVAAASSYPLAEECAVAKINFTDLDVGMRVILPTDEADALVRALAPRTPDHTLIGRSNLSTEVPA